MTLGDDILRPLGVAQRRSMFVVVHHEGVILQHRQDIEGGGAASWIAIGNEQIDEAIELLTTRRDDLRRLVEVRERRSAASPPTDVVLVDDEGRETRSRPITIGDSGGAGDAIKLSCDGREMVVGDARCDDLMCSTCHPGPRTW